MMERVALSRELSLSRMAYGFWRLTEDDTSPAHIQAKIEACLEQGITTLDHAAVYGGYTAEAALGAALTPELRARVEIVTKCGIIMPTGRHSAATVKHYDTSPVHIEDSVAHSLKAMRIEQIDLLLVHRPDPLMDADATGAALDGLVASGKVRGVGVSNFRPHDFSLLQSRMETPLCTNQIELSLAANAAFDNGDLADLQQRRVVPMAWSPLGGGGLMHDDTSLTELLDTIATASGVDRAAVAVAWLLAHPARIIPVMGSNSLARIRRFSEALTVPMDRERWFALLAAARGYDVA